VAEKQRITQQKHAAQVSLAAALPQAIANLISLMHSADTDTARIAASKAIVDKCLPNLKPVAGPVQPIIGLNPLDKPTQQAATLFNQAALGNVGLDEAAQLSTMLSTVIQAQNKDMADILQDLITKLEGHAAKIPQHRSNPSFPRPSPDEAEPLNFNKEPT